MKKKILISVLAMLCTYVTGFPQVNSSSKTLREGDRLPDVTISHISSYPASSQRLSAFNTPLIILDFWATWCGSCIKEFPHVEALAKQFKGQAQFLLVNSRPVTKDDRQKIKYFFSYTKKPKGVAIVQEDTILCSYFDTPSLPRYVWLKQDGTVLAITDQTAVTESRIRQVLAGITAPSPHSSTKVP